MSSKTAPRRATPTRRATVVRKRPPNPQRRKRRKKFEGDSLYHWCVKAFGSVIQEVQLEPLPPLTNIKDDGKRRLTNKWYCIWRTARYKRVITRIPFFAFLTYGVSKDKSLSSLKSHIMWYEELVRDKGPTYAVKLLKRVRDACLRFAADQTFERITELKLHQDGLPLRVGHLMEFLKSSNIAHRRFAIFVLDIIKLVEVEGDEPSSDSITNPLRGPVEISGEYLGETIEKMGIAAGLSDFRSQTFAEAFRSELKRMFPQKKQKERLLELSARSDIHMSVRTGPNGPALGGILLDWVAIAKSGLLEPITWVAQHTSNEELLLVLDEIEQGLSSDPLPEGFGETSCDSRLAVKYEPWCKTRFFAICDWFSQSALLGLHKWIFSWLERQLEDGTMSQDRVAEIVRGWTSPAPLWPASKRVYSLDLSKATDRLPATLQREIIQQMFGKDFADRWYTICTKRRFRKPNGEYVSFSVGQPLGVYSSWAMLALTHHLICRTALRLCGRKRDVSEAQYVVIGDDVAMVGDDFAEYYTLIMHTILQVEISPTKGFTPSSSLGVNPLVHHPNSLSAELAKRIFVDGFELTTVSPETLKSAVEYPADFPNLLTQLTNRRHSLDAMTPVAPIALACLGYKPRLACTFATFPLRPVVSKETVAAASGTGLGLLTFIPWFNASIPISEYELETMFRCVIRTSLQSILGKFKDQYYKFIELSRRPIQDGNRLYRFTVQEYVTRALLNKAMALILNLIVKTNALNFFGPGRQLDEIASALNTMTDFERALLGKPSSKRENLHRMRSRVITSLQPFVLQAIRKAEDNWGILLIDQGEQIEFVPHNLVDLHNQHLCTRGLLSTSKSRLRCDQCFARAMALVEKRTEEVKAISP